jgi:hypothetical protein
VQHYLKHIYSWNLIIFVFIRTGYTYTHIGITFFASFLSLKCIHIPVQKIYTTHDNSCSFYYLTVICIPIYNHINQIRHVQQHYEVWSVFKIRIIVWTFYDLQYMYIYNLSCLRTIYAKYSNSTTKLNNIYNSNQTYK